MGRKNQSTPKWAILFDAARNDDQETVKSFVEKDLSLLTFRNTYGQTVAHIAAHYNRETVLKYLLEKNDYLYRAQDDRRNLISHTAAAAGAERVIKFLADNLHSTMFWSQNGDGDTALHVAARNGRQDLVEDLMDVYNMQPNLRNFRNETGAHLSAKNGHVVTLKVQLDRDPSLLTAVDSIQNNVLHLAAGKGPLIALQFLCRVLEADVNVPNGYGEYPLHLAAMSGLLDIVQFFVEERHVSPVLAEVGRTSDTAAHLAASLGKLNVLEYLIEKQRVDVDIKNRNGQTPLLEATRANRLDVVKYLIKKGASPSATDSMKEDVFFYAAKNRDLSIPKYLLDESKVVSVTPRLNAFNKTLLYKAATAGNVAFMKYMIEEKKLDPNTANPDGRTPFFAAITRRHGTMIKYLLERGANVMRRDGKHRTIVEFGLDNVIIKEVNARNETMLLQQVDYISPPVGWAAQQAPKPPTIASSTESAVRARRMVSEYPGSSKVSSPSGAMNLGAMNQFLFLVDTLFRKRRGSGYHFAGAANKFAPTRQQILEGKVDPLALAAVSSDRYGRR